MSGAGRRASPAGTSAPDRSHRPPPGAVRPLRLPRFDRFRLSSGLDVHVAERRDVPEVSLRLAVEAGVSAEPEGQGGVAELTARLLTEGAGERDAREMAVWLDRLGVGFRAHVSYDVASMSMHCLSEVTEEALDFLATAVREPRFEAAEVERVRDERLDEIDRERDEPAVVADHRLIEAVYGNHPYGRPAAGVRETVEGLGEDQVRGFHRRGYGAAGASLVVCGDVSGAELRDGLERRFGDWPAGAGRSDVGDQAPGTPSAGLVLVDRPGSPQAEVRVGGVGAPYGDPEQFPMILANAIVGGLFNSRLNMNLREEKGWTYGARSYFRFRRRAGPFVARTAVETPVTADTFREVLSELRGLAERPPSDTELRLAKNALGLSLPLQFETNSQVVGRVSQRIVYGLPDDYWETYRDRVEAVTRDQVVAVTKKYLDPERLELVAVTDAGAVREALEGLRPVDLREDPRDGA